MEDIAEAAGMSRPALYLHFRNKAEIFRAGSEAVHTSALDAATKAIGQDGALEDRLAGFLIAYKGAAWRIIVETPHGREMIDLSSSLAEDETHAIMEKAIAIMTDAIAREAAPDWDAEALARLLSASAWSVV
ncbi:MAG: helix-turn-helix domain-containing protein, partial [Pseudomonadota bacterium]